MVALFGEESYTSGVIAEVFIASPSFQFCFMPVAEDGIAQHPASATCCQAALPQQTLGSPELEAKKNSLSSVRHFWSGCFIAATEQ